MSKLTVKQLAIATTFYQIPTMDDSKLHEFQLELADCFKGNYNHIAFRRATTAIMKRALKLRDEPKLYASARDAAHMAELMNNSFKTPKNGDVWDFQLNN